MNELTLSQQLRELREKATAGKHFAYRSEKGPTVQVAKGWVLVASLHGTMDDCELAAWCANNALAIATALDEREGEVERLRDCLLALRASHTCRLAVSVIDAALTPEVKHESR